MHTIFPAAIKRLLLIWIASRGDSRMGDLWDWALQIIGPFKGAAILAATQRLWHFKLSDGREGFARAIWLCLKSAFGVFNRSLACWSQIRGLPGCRGWDAGPASPPAAAAPGRHGWQQLRGVRRDARLQRDWGARAAGRSHPQLPAYCRHWASRGRARNVSRQGKAPGSPAAAAEDGPGAPQRPQSCPPGSETRSLFRLALSAGDRSCLPPPAYFFSFSRCHAAPIGATLPAGRGPGPPSSRIPRFGRATCPVSPRGPRRSSWEPLTRQ